MARKQTSEINYADAPNIRTRLAVFVMSEKGGVWKSSLVCRLVPFLESAGMRVGVVQVDQQPILDIVFPGQVVTVAMPNAARLREDDTADAVALSKLYDALIDTDQDVTVVDVGANLDQRVVSFMASVALHEVLAAAGRAPLGLVPMRPEDEAVELGCRTMRRLPIALPNVRLVPVLCADAERSFPSLGDAAQAQFDAEVAPRMASGDGMYFHRLNPAAVQALGRSGLTAHAFANLTTDELMQRTKLHPAVARQVQGDIIGHVAKIEEEMGRIFGPFCGAGREDREPAS
ncbi:hypothetical protein [Methylobacterium sp. D54C]